MKAFRTKNFRVRFADTDMAGIAHFTAILKWVENAEGDFFRENGFCLAEQINKKIVGWPKLKLNIEFTAPAKYDDEIFVEISPASLPQENSHSLTWNFTIKKLDDDGKTLKIAAGTWTSIYAEIEVESGKISTTNPCPQKIIQCLYKNF